MFLGRSLSEPVSIQKCLKLYSKNSPIIQKFQNDDILGLWDNLLTV
jgi:hypothetical protein